MLRPILFSFLVLTNVSAAFAAAPELKPLQISEDRLENGLRVVFVPFHEAPTFGLSVTYVVGSRNEVPGYTGLAHFFEHMMFDGSANVGKNEHTLLISNNGGHDNATTSQDRTNYFETLPKNQLDLALFLESDRMRSLAVTQKNIDDEKHAVKEEQKFRIANQPYAPGELEIENLAYDNFAYKHWIIGTMDDLDRARTKDFMDFFHTYYAPNNAVLTIVGDFDKDEVMAKVKKYFGSIRSHSLPRQPLLKEEPHLGERRETVEDPLARLPKLLAVYIGPDGNTPDHYALEVLGTVLAEGQSSRLYLHLVKEKQLATAVDAGPISRTGPSLFYLVATPKPGVPLSKLEEAIYEEVEALKKTPITQEELLRAQRQNLMDQIQSRDTSLELAYRIGEDAVVFGDAKLVNTAVDKFNAVTIPQIQQAANKYFNAAQRTVVYIIPKKTPSAPKEAKP